MPLSRVRSALTGVRPALTPALLVLGLSIASADPVFALSLQASTGANEGTVEVRTPPPRRTANRYASGRVQPAKTVQQLPAVVYLIGGTVDRAPASPALTMAQRSTDGVNHGKESSKFNQDCAICCTCRPTIPDAAVLKGRGNGIKWRV